MPDSAHPDEETADIEQGSGAAAKAPEPALVSDQARAGLDPSGFDQAQGVIGEILRPRGCDDEVASIMDQLDRLQTWLVMKGVERRGDREYMSAATLIQNTRCLIVERCFKGAGK